LPGFTPDSNAPTPIPTHAWRDHKFKASRQIQGFGYVESSAASRSNTAEPDTESASTTTKTPPASHLAAGQDPAKLWFQFQYLEKLGLTAYAKRTLLALKKTESSSKPVYLALLRILELEGKLSSLIELVREMTQKFPSDLEPQNDLAYLQLLANQDLIHSSAIAEKLVSANPDWLSFRTTLALAYLRHSEPEKAAQVYAGLKIDWPKAPPAWRAVHAAVLAASGNRSEAQVRAKEIPISRLRREELMLIENLL